MPNWLTVDDLSDQIGYYGVWERLAGSTRQWEGGVHSTTQAGASCLLRFKGTGVIVVVTILSGSGSPQFQYQIDDRAPITLSLPEQSANKYAHEALQEINLSDGIHTIRLVNVGGEAFQLDRFRYLPSSSDPNPAPLYPNEAPENQPAPPTPPPQPQSTTEPPSQPTFNSPPQPQTTAGQTNVVIAPPNAPSSTPAQGLPSKSDDEHPASVRAGDTPGTLSFPSVRSGADSTMGPRTIVNTDSNGQPFTKIIQFATTTDSSGQVTTVTVEATPSKNLTLPVGAVVGIAVGGLLALLAIFFLILFCLRRRKRAKRAQDGQVRLQVTQYAPQAVYCVSEFQSTADLISPFTVDSPTTTPLSTTTFLRKGEPPISPLTDTLLAFSERSYRPRGAREESAGESRSQASRSEKGMPRVVPLEDPPPAYHARS